MKIGVVQMKICDLVESNFCKILYFLDKAKNEQVDLVCFPEMALTGYNIELLQSQDLN